MTEEKLMAVIGIGDRVRVIDTEDYLITGTVVEDWGKRLVITDDGAETLDDRLDFRRSDLELIEGNKYGGKLL